MLRGPRVARTRPLRRPCSFAGAPVMAQHVFNLNLTPAQPRASVSRAPVSESGFDWGTVPAVWQPAARPWRRGNGAVAAVAHDGRLAKSEPGESCPCCLVLDSSSDTFWILCCSACSLLCLCRISSHLLFCLHVLQAHGSEAMPQLASFPRLLCFTAMLCAPSRC